ncbi:MAG: hypothetical protein KJS97_13065 [Alphaproteobacteria bacterium]|nr:hypothetical protein [Alphaproteobacteria bacterium]
MKKLSFALAALALLPLTACATGGGDKPSPAGEAAAKAEAAKPAKEKGFLARLGSDNSKPNVGPCPLIGILYDNARVVQFAAPEERFANVAYTGEIQGVRGLCRYVGSDPIVMNLAIDMAFGKGPKGEATSHTYKYWVAVTRKDAAPIAKQYFEITANFKNGADRVGGTDVIERIVIPRASETTSGANFEILVGFDLTPEQLAFNRDGKRFRVDAGS